MDNRAISDWNNLHFDLFLSVFPEKILRGQGYFLLRIWLQSEGVTVDCWLIIVDCKYSYADSLTLVTLHNATVYTQVFGYFNYLYYSVIVHNILQLIGLLTFIIGVFA